MKVRKFWFMIAIFGFIILLSNTALAACAGCVGNHSGCKNKSYKYYNKDRHQIYCCCGDPIVTSGFATSLENHSWNRSSANCTTAKKCNRCGYVAEAKLGHKTPTSWKTSSTQHWKVCSRGCGTIVVKKADHSGGTATCTTKAKCSTCGEKYGSVLGHTTPSTWTTDGTQHWKVCGRGCGTIVVAKANHSGGTATCTTKAKCSTCGEEYGSVLNHTGGTATCQVKKVCTRCGASYGELASHNYTVTCSEAHCSVKKCQWCGRHKSTCGGGHTYETCSHCKVTFCNQCTTHTPKVTCPCNNDKSCSEQHCADAGITWCSYCGTHTSHVPCNTNATCPQPHCTQKVCSVCGGNHQGACGGGHIYEWVTNSSGESQTHTNKCKVTSTCTATNGQHSAVWGKANSSHTSTCQKCNLTYTHGAVWSTAQRSGNEAHPCAWHIGCSATHSANWGAYYKVNGGVSGDSDGGPHTRKCGTCGITEVYHSYTTESWSWLDTTKHIRSCKTCGISQTLSHNFTRYEKKSVNSTTHSELYKHWKICTTCDPNHREVDETHTDNGSGTCTKCGQILWKMITEPDGTDITQKIINEERRKATREEKIKIVEVVNGTPQYIQNLRGADNLTAENNIITIIKNGKYEFTTGRGGTVTFKIDNISREIVIEKIIDPVTSTTGTVTITIRTSKSEEQFDKKVYIKEGLDDSITNAYVENNGSNPFILTKTVNQNGTYYFTAKDTIGNEKGIKIVIDNIIKGQTTVAISNDVFINGYIFTEILVNPNKEWTIGEEISNVVKAKAYKTGSTTGVDLGSNNIKLIKIMDMQRQEIQKNGNGKYNPGSYYIQVAIGGNIFNSAGTYIIDLEKVNITTGSVNAELGGKNRITVEVQDLKDIT